METVRFWYTFEGKDQEMSNTDVEISLSHEDGIKREEICEAFVRFLAAAGFFTGGLAEMFED